MVVSIERQRLALFRAGALAAEWPVSTSRFGVGSLRDSFKTPLGLHRIAEKIGADLPLDTVFKGRKPVPRPPTSDLRPSTDLIMSRILWLDGSEPGLNRGGDVDSHDRYIYIHGTVHEDRIGTPDSHGCVRMRNADVAALFEQVEQGTPVMIA
ncbi:MAG: L,D-transpeptidase [Verrucomicrobia bacterium]|nr:L,D-transpeptidase [Verrucomicrobiota bacterium]